jgi:SPP1 family holin
MNLKGVTKSTWVRLISMLLVFVNLIARELFNFELLPFDDTEINDGVSVLLTVVIATWGTWKNNSVTAKAQEADKVLKGDK